MKRNAFKILVISLILIMAGQVSAQRGQVRVAQEAKLQPGPVSLSMIADITSNDPELKERLEQLVIGHFSEDGSVTSLGRFEVTRALAQANIVPASLDIYGSKQCLLVVQSNQEMIVEKIEQELPIEPSEPKEIDEKLTLRYHVNNMIAKQSGIERARLKIEWHGERFEKLLKQAYDKKRFHVSPKSIMGPGRVAVEVFDRQAEKNNQRRIRLTAKVLYLCDSIVTTRMLKAGEVIQEDDVKIIQRRVDSMRDIGLAELKYIVGQEVARAMPVNTVIQPKMIRKITMVKRGDVVNVSYNDGRISLRLRAKANQNGSLGDRIKVVDVYHKQEFQAVITGKGEVLVKPNSDQTNSVTTNDVNKDHSTTKGSLG